MMHYTISATVLRILYKLLEYYQKDAEKVFSLADLSKKEIVDERKRIPYQKAYLLWSEVSKLIEDPCFGLKTATVFHPSDLNVLGYAWLSSSTLRTAFERLHRYQKMVSEFIEISLNEADDLFEVSLNVQDKSIVTMAQMDTGVTVLFHMCQCNYGQTLKPSVVYLTHAKPDCYQKYYEYFQCDVLFDQVETKLCFPATILDEPLLNSMPNMSFMTDKTIIDYLESMHEENTITKVKQAIMKLLPSEVSIEKVTNILHLTPRTLHRHLKAEGTTFKHILDDVRYDLSKEYILNNNYSLTEIAFQLGFSDSSAFSRAFKHWSGQSPSHYKKQPQIRDF